MILDNLKKYIDYKGISVAAFEKSIGMSNNSFRKSWLAGKGIGTDKLENILNIYPDINMSWLFTGQGEMLKEKSPNEGYHTSQENASTDIVSESLVKYQAVPKIGNQSSSIPYEFVQSMIDERKRNDEMYAELIRQNGVLVDILKGEIADLKKRDARLDGSVSDADATKSAI